MRIKDIMQRHVDYASVTTSVKDVSRIIFGRNINGVPVCKDKKVVGFITERDILSRFFPSIGEFIEDPVRARDFEGMEKRVEEILSLPAEAIMSKKITTVLMNTPVLRAQSLMLSAKVGRLPVVDESGNLIGIVSKSDIFKAVVGKSVPLGKEEKFYDWLSKHYDVFINWKKRLALEIPELVEVLNKAKAKTVIDVASSTGEHSIALAREGYEVYGLETSKLIARIAEEKRAELPKKIHDKVKFLWGKYEDVVEELPQQIDAALFLGNALSHVLFTDKNILEDVNKFLNPEKAVLVFQIINFNKILNKSTPMEEFIVRSSHLGNEKKHAFLGFYTRVKGKISYTQAIFDFDGGKWSFSGMNSTPVVEIDKKELRRRLRKLGFKKIFIYGGQMYGSMFKKPFDPAESEFMNVVAKR